MSLQTESLNNHKMSRVLRVIEESRILPEEFIEFIFVPTFLESRSDDVGNFLSNLERKVFNTNEAWYDRLFNLFRRKKTPVDDIVPTTSREYGGKSYLGRTAGEAESMVSHARGRDLAGGQAGELVIKNMMKQFLFGKDGNIENLLAKIHMPNLSPNKISMLKSLARGLNKFIDGYEFKYTIASSEEQKQKMISQHKNVLSKMASKQLADVLGFAGDIIADFDKFSAGQQSGLYSRLQNIASGKLSPEHLSRIDMNNYDKNAIIKFAQDALNTIEEKKGMGKLGSEPAATNVGNSEKAAPAYEPGEAPPVDTRGVKTKDPVGLAGRELRKQRLQYMKNLNDYLGAFFKYSGDDNTVQQVENEKDFMDVLKRKEKPFGPWNNVVTRLKFDADKIEASNPKLASSLRALANDVTAEFKKK